MYGSELNWTELNWTEVKWIIFYYTANRSFCQVSTKIYIFSALPIKHTTKSYVIIDIGNIISLT